MHDRYQRQEILPGIGAEGQTKLARARVLIIGMGGLGAPAALYLAGAGVGRLGLVDFDEVALSNLHRQILYRSSDHGAAKALVAARELSALNPEIEVRAHVRRADSDNLAALITDYDLVIDGCDDRATRYAAHDACYRQGIPYIYGAVFQFEGQVSVFARGEGPCLRCLFPERPEAPVTSCAEGGTLGPVTGVIGSLQATQALQLILGIGAPSFGRLLVYDALTATLRNLALSRDENCALCGSAPAAHATARAADPADATASPAPLSLEDFLARFPDAAIVDLRQARERTAGVIPGARFDAELADLEELTATRPVLLYCQRGVRSQVAASRLRARGRGNIHQLTGGYDAFARGCAQVQSMPLDPLRGPA